MNPVLCGARRNLASLLELVCRPLPSIPAARWLTGAAFFSVLVLIGLLLATSAIAAPPAPPEAPSSQRLADVEQQLAQARKRLDEAALELSRLHEAAEVSAQKKGGRAMLGVLIDDPKRREGVFISGVTPGGGAAAAGLRSGDVLVAINGQVMDGSAGHPHSHISKIMSGVTAGDPVTVRYLRGRNEIEAKIVTQASGHYAVGLAGFDKGFDNKQRIEIDMDCFKPEDLLDELSDTMGLDLGDAAMAIAGTSVARSDGRSPLLVDLNPDLARYFDTDSGVLVVNPPAGSSALKAGDVLDQVAGKPVTDVQDALAMLHLSDTDKPIKLQVIRQGKTRVVSVHPELFSTPDARVIRISGDDGELRIELSRTPTGRTNLAP